MFTEVFQYSIAYTKLQIHFRYPYLSVAIGICRLSREPGLVVQFIGIDKAWINRRPENTLKKGKEFA